MDSQDRHGDQQVVMCQAINQYQSINIWSAQCQPEAESEAKKIKKNRTTNVT